MSAVTKTIEDLRAEVANLAALAKNADDCAARARTRASAERLSRQADIRRHRLATAREALRALGG